MYWYKKYAGPDSPVGSKKSDMRMNKDFEQLRQLAEEQRRAVEPIFEGTEGWLRIGTKHGLIGVHAGLGSDPDGTGRPAIADPQFSKAAYSILESRGLLQL